jgi:transposase-like protein
MPTGLKNKLATVKEPVKEAYENGATLREIAEVHDVSTGTVRNCLIEMGVELRNRGRRRKSTDVESRLLPLESVETQA